MSISDLTDTPEYGFNGDLEEIVTPVKTEKLEEWLLKARCNKEKTEFLVKGFKHGFDIGYQGPELRSSTAPNLPLSVGNPVQLWNKLIKEVKLGRVVGPFDRVPYKHYIQSPIGLVPKSGSKDKTRLIFYLSYDFDKVRRLRSINYHTPQELCLVHYRDLDTAIQVYLKLIQGQDNSSCIFTGKTDVLSTFRVVPLAKLSLKWLIMKMVNQDTAAVQYIS